MGDKKLPFLDRNAGPPKAPTLLNIAAQVWHQVWAVVACFCGVTLGAAWLFYIGTPGGWGIQPTFATAHAAGSPVPSSFFDCIYFSVVTISTVGYGDYRP